MSTETNTKPAKSVTGAYLSAAWNEWLKTDEAKECLQPGIIEEKYLKNRLWTAFMKGADEALRGSNFLNKHT